MQLFLSLGPSFSASAAECCRLLDDSCLYLPRGFFSSSTREGLFLGTTVPTEGSLSPHYATAAPFAAAPAAFTDSIVEEQRKR